jgi:hypothetical protein
MAYFAFGFRELEIVGTNRVGAVSGRRQGPAEHIEMRGLQGIDAKPTAPPDLALRMLGHPILGT